MHNGETIFQWYSLLPLIGMFFMLSLAVVSLVSGRKVLLWKMLAIFALLLSLTAFFAFKATISTNDYELYKYVRFAPFFAVMSVLFAVHYSMLLTGQPNHIELFFGRASLRTYIFFVVIPLGVILALALHKGLVLSSAYLTEPGGIRIEYGPLIALPLIIIIGGFTKIIISINRTYRSSVDKSFRKFLRLNLLAFRVTYGPALGLFIILPLFGIQSQVFAFIAFPLAVVIFYIAIVRYQFDMVDDLNRGLERKVEERTAQLKHAQSRLVQAEKMASLGTLAAGVAHEINNPIGAVISIHGSLVSAIDNLKNCLPQKRDDSGCEKLEQSLKIIDDANRVINDGSRRVADIVRTLKSFARLDQADLQKADIHMGLDDTIKLISHQLKNRITIEKKYSDIPEINCFPGPLNQVFLNILINAIQAIEGEGKITISTSKVGDHIRVVISDTGKGISAENLKKIFDPGYTTKGVGVGTGLGLSICYQIIEDHQGEIKVESEPGKGTTFTIIIPANLNTENNGL